METIFGGRLAENDPLSEQATNVKIQDKKLEFFVDSSEVGRPPRKFVKGEYLGKGGFATCFKVIECSQSKREYACKIISKKDFEVRDVRKRMHAENKKVKLEREVRIQKTLLHEHLVRLVHFFEDTENIYLLMDLCENQSLHDLL